METCIYYALEEAPSSLGHCFRAGGRQGRDMIDVKSGSLPILDAEFWVFDVIYWQLHYHTKTQKNKAMFWDVAMNGK